MEMHLVHFNERVTTYNFSAQAGISVVAVLFEVSQSSSFEMVTRHRIKPFFFQFSEKENERVNVLLDMISSNSTVRGIDKNSVSYRDLLPEQFQIMYQYDGSLTTPPCVESVLWNVINEKSYVTRRQVKQIIIKLLQTCKHTRVTSKLLPQIGELQRLLNKRTSTKSGPHCRQVQPLNDRPVYVIRQERFEVLEGSAGVEVHSKLNIIFISFLLNFIIVNRYE